MIPLSLILRKAKAAHEFLGSKEKINYLLFMDNLKIERIGLISPDSLCF